MKKIFAIFALAAMTLIFVPEVQAQTAAQQKELEAIAKRSASGLSAKDRQRAIQILTDMYMKQGMSKQQAEQIAAMAADTMLTGGIKPMSAEEERQVKEWQTEEQNRANNSFEQAQQPENDGFQIRDRWPTAADCKRYGVTITRPRGNFVATFEKEGEALVIKLWKTADATGYFTDAEFDAIRRQFDIIFAPTKHQTNKTWIAERQDPQKRDTEHVRYVIGLIIDNHGGHIEVRIVPQLRQSAG